MSKDRESKKINLIEAAMNESYGIGADHATYAQTQVDTHSVWLHDQDRSLKLRLQQLQTGLASNEPNRPTVISAAPTLQPALKPANQPSTDKYYGPAAFFLTAVFSALGGAGLMWLVMVGSGQNRKPLHLPSRISAPTPSPIAPEIPVVAAMSTPAPSASEPAPATAAAPVTSSESKARDLIEGWRHAWSGRDASGYLAYYGPEFVAANGQKRANWEKARQRNFSSRSSIEVGVRDLRVERVSEDRIKAFFLQDYTSGNYRENAKPKTLLLERAGQEWKIAGEWEGDYTFTPQATQ